MMYILQALYSKPEKQRLHKFKVTFITICQRVRFLKNLIDILPQNLQPDEDDVIK